MTESEPAQEDVDGEDSALDAMLRAVVAAPPVDPEALLARVARTRRSPGDVIGERLVVERELGAGGMGVVYLARDAELERPVAVKICRRQTDDATARMLDEARAAASLRHDNVVVVHDVGTTGELVYVAMEYIDGGNLREWLETPRSRDAILDVVRRAGQGLAAAHAAGLVHRDFKPDNILVGNDGRVRVADFGLAHTGQSGATAETIDGRAGTPGYMPPELREASELDDRADVFAFGVTLHEALTGSRIDGPEGVARSLPRRVRAVIRACVDPSPAHRPAIGTVLDRLAPRSNTLLLVTTGLFVALVGGLAVASQDGSACNEPEIDAPRWDEATRTRLEQALRSGVVIDPDVLVARVLSLLDERHAQWTRVEHEVCVDHRDTGRTDVATHAAQHACLTVRAAELQAVVDTLTSGEREHVDAAPGLVEGLRSSETCREAAPDPRVADGQTLARMTEIRAELARAQTERRAGDFQAALERVEVLVPEVEDIGDPALAAERWDAVARAQQSLGDPTQAQQTARDFALPLAIEAGEPRLCARIAIDLVESAGQSSDYAAAKQWASFAEAWLTRAGDPSHERYLLELTWGRAAQIANDRAAAVRHLGRALALSASIPDATPSMRTNALENWGAAVAIDRARADEGIEALQEAFALGVQHWGRGAPRTWHSAAGLVSALTFLDRVDEAMPLIDEHLSVAQQIFGPAHHNTLSTRADLARLLMQTERYAEARTELVGVLGAAPEDDPGFYELRTSVLQMLSVLDRGEGDLEGARANLERMLAVTEQMGDAGRYKGGLGLISLANVELTEERFDRAAEVASRARARLADVVGEDGFETLAAGSTWIKAEVGRRRGAEVVEEAAEIRRLFAKRASLDADEPMRIHELTYGIALRQAGRFAEALAVLEPLLERYTELGMAYSQMSAAFEIAVTLEATGDERAPQSLERARALSREVGEVETAAIDRWARTGEWRPF